MENLPKDYVLLIMNCVKYRYKSAKQKETWLSKNDIPYYHVLGNPLLEKTHEFDEEERILWVKTEDDYNSLPKKVIASYAAIYKCFPQIQYIFKTDDDQMFQSKNIYKFFHKMMAILEEKAKVQKVHYGGHIVNVERPYLSRYHLIHPELPPNLPVHATQYCSGRFYFLSIDAVCDILHKREFICREYLEDYAIGLNLGSRYKQSILQLKTDFFFKDMQQPI